DAGIQACSFNEDGSRLAVNDVVWEVRNHADGHSLRRSAIVTDGLFPVFRGRDEVWAASLESRDGAYVTLWQLTPQKRQFVLPRPSYPDLAREAGEERLVPYGERGLQASFLALSPDRKQLLVASRASFLGKPGEGLIMANPLELWDPIR